MYTNHSICQIFGIFLFLFLPFTQLGAEESIRGTVDSILVDIRTENPEISEQLSQLKSTIKSIKADQPTVALELLEEGINTAKSYQLDTTQAYFLYLKGRIEKRTGDSKKAFDSYQQSKKIYAKLNNKKGLCNTINELGWVAIKKGNYKEARINFQEALAIAALAELPLIEANELNDIGVTFYYQKAYQKAAEYYLKAADIREEQGHEAGLVISYNNLGLIYKLNRDYQNAIKYYAKGLSLAKKRKDLRRIISLNVNLGNIYFEKESFTKAIFNYKEALKNAATYQSKDQIALSNFLVGKAYNKINQNDRAIQYLNKSFVAYQELEEEQNEATTMFELGKAHYLLKAKQKGLALMEKSMRLEKQTNSLSLPNYKYLANIYEEEGQYTKAFDYLSAYTTLKDSVESRDIKENIAGMQIAFEEEFKAKEQAQEIALLTQEQTFQTTRFRLVIVFLGIILCSLLALIWNLIQKTKFNKLLKLQAKELMETNAEKEKAVIQAEKATKAKSEFLSSMSHEIRTPMNAVVGITNILIDEDPLDSQVENLQILKFSSNNLLGIINDILDFSKMEAGNMTLEKIDFSLESLLNNIIETFILTSKNKSIKIRLEADFTRLKKHLVGDPTRLTQILTNLIGNAIKFTNEGYIALQATILDLSEEKATLKFAVQDTGIGIPSHKIDRIFESFTQASDNTTRLYGGTGLGLTITKNLIELQGGKIQVASVEGEGSVFFFTLTMPLGKALSKSKKLKLKSTFSSKTGLIGCSILMAEDNKINQLVARKILAKWKVKLDIANDGVEVLEKVAEKDYDLILMDIQMPRMNGFEATKKIRDLDSPKRDIPIIALTASILNLMSDNSYVKSHQLDAYVCKPFEPNDLYEKITNVIQKKRQKTEVAYLEEG